MALGETFDLARIYSAGESIKAQQRDAALEPLRRKYLEAQTANLTQSGQIAAAQEQRAQQQFSQEQQLYNTQHLNIAAKSIAEDPTTAMRWVPELKKAGVLAPDASIDGLTPDELRDVATTLAKQTDGVLQSYIAQNPKMAELAAQHENQLAEIEARMRGEATLKRQEHGFRLGEIAATGAQARLTDAAKPVAPKDAAKAAAQQAQLATTLRLYETARDGLLQGLSGTSTGPVAGRIPAITSAQQIGEGGVAAMAPVLKQIFRVAGEGTFTDRDQALLLQMVPTRVDTAKARQAKIENIDRIVKAKLGGGVTSATNAPPPGTVQDGYRFKGGDPADQNNWEPVQ